MKMYPILFLILIFIHSGRVFAWGEVGHEVVAEIAEEILAKKDPATLQAIREILGPEQMAVAANWPDKIRSDSRFDMFAPYHFTTVFHDTKKHPKRDALTVLNKFPSVIRDSKSSRDVKMIALRYIIHVVGDIHQPLHVGNEFDKGATVCHVYWQLKSPEETDLHVVWDTNLVEYIKDEIRKKTKNPPRYFGYLPVAKDLMEKYKKLLSKDIKSPDIASWVQESKTLREHEVYPDHLDEDKRPYCKPNYKTQDMPVLGKPYIAKASGIVEQQLVKGGMHLAELLSKTFKGMKSNYVGDKQIFQKLDLTNFN